MKQKSRSIRILINTFLFPLIVIVSLVGMVVFVPFVSFYLYSLFKERLDDSIEKFQTKMENQYKERTK